MDSCAHGFGKLKLVVLESSLLFTYEGLSIKPCAYLYEQSHYPVSYKNSLSLPSGASIIGGL